MLCVFAHFVEFVVGLEGWTFYKVITYGKMTASNVKDTCNSYNLTSPCYYSISNKHTGPDCVPPFSNGISTFVKMSQSLCNGNSQPHKCSKLYGICAYMTNYHSGSSCCVTSSAYCTVGNNLNYQHSLCAKKGK